MKEETNFKWGKGYYNLSCHRCHNIRFHLFGMKKPKRRLYVRCDECGEEWYVVGAKKFKLKKKGRFIK